MVNIDKIKTLAKSKGISISFICEQFGAGRGYLNDIARGKNTMSDDRIHKVARMLDTTYDYLVDLTDDPDPRYAAKNAESPEEKLIHQFIEKVYRLTPEQIENAETLLNSEEIQYMIKSKEELDRILSVVKAMRG